MTDGLKLTLDALIKDELDGKAAAIGRYDEMIWKIRAGYALFLYGAVGIVATLASKNVTDVTPRTALSMLVLVVGLSLYGAFIDYCFMVAKLRVVEYRDRLTELAFARVTGNPSEPENNDGMLECLKNSGEREAPVDWSRRTGRSVPLLYYGGTAFFCTIATLLLAW